MYPCGESLRMKINLKRVFAGLVSFSTGSVELVHGCTSALADMKDGVGGRTIILSRTLAEVHCGVSGTSAHPSGEHLTGPVQKLRHQENVNDQPVRGCHYHLNCS